MTDVETITGVERFEVRVTADTHFGWLRTRLSVERTMMSWVRTAVLSKGTEHSLEVGAENSLVWWMG